MEADGSIDLGPDLHLQIGDTYISLAQEKNGIFTFTDIQSQPDLIAQLQFHTQTFAMIKPGVDSVAVMREIEKRRFKIINQPYFIQLTKDQAEQFYAEHAGRPYFPDLIEYMTSGPISALIITYPSHPSQTINKFREAIGATNSSTPGSIRAMFGNPAITRENAIHASDSKENAKRERAIFNL